MAWTSVEFDRIGRLKLIVTVLVRDRHVGLVIHGLLDVSLDVLVWWVALEGMQASRLGPVRVDDELRDFATSIDGVTDDLASRNRRSKESEESKS